MGKERSFVRKRRRGCLTGCLVNLLLLGGVLALLFVGACLLGFIQNDPETGAPYFTLPQLGEIALPELGELSLPELPAWPYGVKSSGLTVKTLRAGEGEAVLVCSDGYTMLLGAGSGRGIWLCGQLLLSGVNHLSAAVAMQCSEAQIGGMQMAVALLKPDYLLYPDTQVKGTAYNAMLAAAEKNGVTQLLTPGQGLTFSLGRATVTVVGPALTHHTDERDDGLSLRIDYGDTSVLVLGGITENGERELASSGVALQADVLICASGGSEEATGSAIVQAVAPSYALLTGKSPANSVKLRLERAGAQVFCATDNGVMTVYSDGQTVTVEP